MNCRHTLPIWSAGPFYDLHDRHVSMFESHALATSTWPGPTPEPIPKARHRGGTSAILLPVWELAESGRRNPAKRMAAYRRRLGGTAERTSRLPRLRPYAEDSTLARDDRNMAARQLALELDHATAAWNGHN